MSGADFSPGSLGFVRVAVVAPELKVADVRFNTRATIEALEAIAADGGQIALFWHDQKIVTTDKCWHEEHHHPRKIECACNPDQHADATKV